MIYAFVFFAKLMEVTISTVRMVLTAKGYRLYASLLAAAEITLWIVVASNVLLSLSEDPLRAVAYGLAFVAGIYVGILLEDKMALGLSQIEVIAGYEIAKRLTNKLREHGYGVTTYDCEGMDGRKISVSIKVRRKDVPSTIGMFREFEDLFVTVTDIRKLSIGSIGKHVIK